MGGEEGRDLLVGAGESGRVDLMKPIGYGRAMAAELGWRAAFT